MSLLTVVQGACERLGVSRPSIAHSSTDQQIIQIVGLAQQEGKELARRHDWQSIVKEKTFTTVAAETQTGAVPSDFDRIVNDTFYNRTSTRKVDGPLSAQQWQFQKSVVATTLIEVFRFRGDDILIAPTPAAGQTMAYEYVSKNWCQSQASVEAESWAADTDTGILSEELMTLGIIWRWQRVKGLDYAESFRTYEAQVAQAILRDGGKRSFNIGGSRYDRVRSPYIPEGNWNP